MTAAVLEQHTRALATNAPHSAQSANAASSGNTADAATPARTSNTLETATNRSGSLPRVALSVVDADRYATAYRSCWAALATSTHGPVHSTVVEESRTGSFDVQDVPLVIAGKHNRGRMIAVAVLSFLVFCLFVYWAIAETQMPDPSIVPSATQASPAK